MCNGSLPSRLLARTNETNATAIAHRKMTPKTQNAKAIFPGDRQIVLSPGEKVLTNSSSSDSSLLDPEKSFFFVSVCCILTVI